MQINENKETSANMLVRLQYPSFSGFGICYTAIHLKFQQISRDPSPQNAQETETLGAIAAAAHVDLASGQV